MSISNHLDSGLNHFIIINGGPIAIKVIGFCFFKLKIFFVNNKIYYFFCCKTEIKRTKNFLHYTYQPK